LLPVRTSSWGESAWVSSGSFRVSWASTEVEKKLPMTAERMMKAEVASASRPKYLK
jgi:hypothetical protein